MKSQLIIIMSGIRKNKNIMITRIPGQEYMLLMTDQDISIQTIAVNVVKKMVTKVIDHAISKIGPRWSVKIVAGWVTRLNDVCSGARRARQFTKKVNVHYMTWPES